MVWDLSRSVPKVFRTPGNSFINLFHFIFNSKCHFLQMPFFMLLPNVLSIGLPIELPIVLPIVLPIDCGVGSIGLLDCYCTPFAMILIE